MLQPAPAAQNDLEVRYIRAGHLGSVPVPEDLPRMWASPSELDRYSVVEGDLLVGEGGDVGRTAFAPALPDQCLIQNSVHRLRARPGHDLRYIRYCLDSVHSGEWFDVLCNRSTFGHLTREKLVGLPIPSVPLEQQQMVADYLDAETAHIDALIGRKQSLSAASEERYRAYLDHVVSDLPGPRVPLGRFVTAITQGVSPRADSVPARAEEWGLLKLSAVKFGAFHPDENKRLPIDFSFEPGLVPRVGDLLVTRANTPAYVGDACAVTADPGQVVLCDLIYRLRLERALDPEFAAVALLAGAGRAHLASAARGTSQSMVKLRGEDIKATRIPAVSHRVQMKVLDRLGRARVVRERFTSKLQAQILLLIERRQALVTAAVTGELEIPGVAT